MFKRLCYTLLLLLNIFPNPDVNGMQPLDKNFLFTKGKWVKIETSSTGIHKVYFSWLKNIGFSHPESVRIYGSRNERISQSNKASDENSPVQVPAMRMTGMGGNDFFLFYVQGPVNWNFDPVTDQYRPILNQPARSKSWYFLTEDSGTDLLFPLGQ